MIISKSWLMKSFKLISHVTPNTFHSKLRHDRYQIYKMCKRPSIFYFLRFIFPHAHLDVIFLLHLLLRCSLLTHTNCCRNEMPQSDVHVHFVCGFCFGELKLDMTQRVAVIFLFEFIAAHLGAHFSKKKCGKFKNTTT